jgi:hypothetical protein
MVSCSIRSCTSCNVRGVRDGLYGWKRHPDVAGCLSITVTV